MNGSFPALELTHHRGAVYPRQLVAPSDRSSAPPPAPPSTPPRPPAGPLAPTVSRGGTDAEVTGPRRGDEQGPCPAPYAVSAKRGREARVRGEVAVDLAGGGIAGGHPPPAGSPEAA